MQSNDGEAAKVEEDDERNQENLVDETSQILSELKLS